MGMRIILVMIWPMRVAMTITFLWVVMAVVVSPCRDSYWVVIMMLMMMAMLMPVAMSMAMTMTGMSFSR